MSNSTTTTVETLTAEVRVLMVGSRQVTLSVYGQLDRVRYDDMEPFGRVRPKGNDDDYICLVGRRKADGALVRATVPASVEVIGPMVGFYESEYASLCRRANDADERAKHYESKPPGIILIQAGTTRTPEEAALECRDIAKRLRESAGRMLAKYEEDREPHLARMEEAEDLPLIVLAGLR